MRIGVIAPEFPPMLGGMAELARGLTTALAATDTVRVHTLSGHGADAGVAGPWEPGVPVRGRPRHDARVLAPLEVGDRDRPALDAWLGLNAGLVPLARHLDAPFFCYLHGNDFTNPWLACGPRALEALRRPYAARVRHALRRRAIRRDLGAVAHLFTNSHQTAALVRERLDVAADRVSVVHPGVHDDFFQQCEEPAGRDRDEDAPLRVLTVTRLTRHTRRKNVDGVLRAVARLRDELAIEYTVVGDGDDRPRLEVLAEELGIADRVRFTGAVDLDGLLAAYRRADLFVMASLASEHDVEGFGIVYLEAAAAGVPSICSREGGATDAVVDGTNGLLIDRSSAESIAAGLRRFLAERERFSPDAVRAFAEGFRWPAIAGRLRGILLDALAEE